MTNLTANLIPAWFVAFMMISTGIMWVISRGRKIRMDSRAFAVTFILEGCIYLLFNSYDVKIEVRGFFVRLMIIILCTSQFLPLAVSFYRSIKRDDNN